MTFLRFKHIRNAGHVHSNVASLPTTLRGVPLPGAGGAQNRSGGDVCRWSSRESFGKALKLRGVSDLSHVFGSDGARRTKSDRKAG